MKKRHLIVVLIIMGSWISLYATENLIGRLVTSKEQACKNIEYQIEIGKCDKTYDINKLYLEKRSRGLQNSALQLFLGISIVAIGIILYSKNKPTLNKKNNIAFEIAINVFYWILSIFGVGFLVFGKWIHIDSCAITWIYLVLVAATIGFYGGYFILQKNPAIKFINARFIAHTLIISAIGGLCSYFPLGIIPSYTTSNYSSLFSIAFILAVGFFCFISCLHVIIGFLVKKHVINKVRVKL